MIPNFENIHRMLVQADRKAIDSGTGILDDTWRARFRRYAADILKLYNAGYYSIPIDSVILGDPNFRKPMMNAPNHFIIPGGPFGRAPPIVNSVCNLADVLPEMIMEPVVFAE